MLKLVQKGKILVEKMRIIQRKELLRLMESAHSIDAVYDEELDELLTGLEVIDDFYNGKFCCYFCEVQINKNNLGSIFAHENDIKMCCNGLVCAKELMRIKHGE